MLMLAFFIFTILYFWIEFSYYVPKKIKEYEERKVFQDRYERKIKKKIFTTNTVVFAIISVLLFIFEDLTSYGIMPSVAICGINLVLLYWTYADEAEIIRLINEQRANRKRK